MRLLAALSVMAGTVYLLWRAAITGRGANPGLFVLLFVAEALVFVRHFLRMAPTLFLARGGEVAAPSRLPSTDIVVVVTDEPLIQVRIALRSCLEVRGRRRIIVVDVYDRPDVAAVTDRLGLIRATLGARADLGPEVNRLLEESGAEFVTVITASMAAIPDVAVLPSAAFDSPDVGAVAMPAQLIGTAGLVGGNGYRPTADVSVELARRLDNVGVAWPVDGPVVFRREALDAVGGFVAGVTRLALPVVAEMQAAGWRTRFVEVVGAYRSAPWDEDHALRIRSYLVEGWLGLDGQNVARGEHSLWARLPLALTSLEQRMVLVRVLVLALPAVVAFTGWLPLTTSVGQAALLGLPWAVTHALSRHFVIDDDEPFAAGLRVGVRTLAVDLRLMPRVRRRHLIPGASARQQTVATLGLVAAAMVAAFAQMAGFARSELPDLAHGTVVVAAIVLLWLARESSWSVSDRQRRVLPRVTYPSAGPGEVTEVSVFGADVAGAMTGSAEVVMDVALPLPGPRAFERSVTGVVVRGSTDGKGRGSYVQFDLDDDFFDEIAYYCAVTGPTLTAQHRDLRAFGSPRPTGVVRQAATQQLRPSLTSMPPRQVQASR